MLALRGETSSLLQQARDATPAGTLHSHRELSGCGADPDRQPTAAVRDREIKTEAIETVVIGGGHAGPVFRSRKRTSCRGSKRHGNGAEGQSGRSLESYHLPYHATLAGRDQQAIPFGLGQYQRRPVQEDLELHTQHPETEVD